MRKVSLVKNAKKEVNRPDKIQSERISVSLTSNACVCKPFQTCRAVVRTIFVFV